MRWASPSIIRWGTRSGGSAPPARLDRHPLTPRNIVGTLRLANDPNSPISKLPIAEKLKVRDKADIQRIYLWLG